MKLTHGPKLDLCESCAKKYDDCSSLNFSEMRVIDTCNQTGFKAVICSERWPAPRRYSIDDCQSDNEALTEAIDDQEFSGLVVELIK